MAASRMPASLDGTSLRNAIPSCNSRVSHSARSGRSRRASENVAQPKSRAASRPAASSQNLRANSGRPWERFEACASSHLSSNDAERNSDSHSMFTASLRATADRILGSSGKSAISMSRCPLWGSRSSRRLSRSHKLANSLEVPSAHSMVSMSGSDRRRFTATTSFMEAGSCLPLPSRPRSRDSRRREPPER